MSSIASPRSSTSSRSTSTNTNSNLRASTSTNHPNPAAGAALAALGANNLGAGISLLNFHDNSSLGAGERLLGTAAARSKKSAKASRMGLGAGFNAISTVLNNPTRPQPPIDPSSSRYPPLAPNHVNAELPTVKRSDHSAYIDSVGSEWARWVGSVKQGREGRVNLGKSKEGQDQPEEDEADQEERRTMATRKRLAPLSAVPQVFFSEEFSLGNPYTFDLVTERYKSTGSNEDDDLKGGIGSPPLGPSNSSSSSSSTSAGMASNMNGYDPALNSMLLEKLSYYSDVLEQHLTLEISARSSSFFNALSNLQDLSSSTTSCLKSIENLQKELVEMEGKSKKHAKAVKFGQERRIWQERERGVRIIREICRAVEVVGILAEAGEREEALKIRDQVLKALEPKRRSSVSTSKRNHQVGSENSNRVNQQRINGQRSNSTNGLGTPIHLQGEFGSPMTASEDEYDDPSNPSPSSPASKRFNTNNHSDPLDEQVQDEVNQSPSMFGEAELDLDLSQIPSLMSLKPQLHNLSAAISQQVEEELLGVLRSDLALKSSPSQAVESGLRDSILPLIRLLVRTSAVERACGQGWRELALGSVKEVVRGEARSRAESVEVEVEVGENGENGEENKKALRDLPSLLEDESFTSLVGNNEIPSSSTPSNQSSTVTATAALASAQYIKGLKQETFLEFLISLFGSTMVCLNSIKRQSDVLLQILNGIGREENQSSSPNRSNPTSPNQSQPQSQELALLMPSDVSPSLPQLLLTTLHLSTDLSHQLFSRLLSLRSTSHSSLTLEAFLETFRPTWEFILTSESLSRRMVTGLRGQVLNQAKNWLIEFHKKNIEDASRKVEEEKWDQKDVDWKSQANVGLIIDAATNDPDELVIGSNQGTAILENGNGDSSADKEPSKTLQIEQGSYAVVQASLDTLNLLTEYLKVVINLPMMTTETMGRTVEFLKAFNSRTCQVVLGAGAMRSAGLKNITAKHLALASQSLSIMISLIPYVRETIRRHLTATQAVMLTEFDKLRRDYQEHQYEIHAKLVAIMSDRLTFHCRTLAAVSWSAPLPSSPPETNKYAIDLVKETATLHKVLSKYLQVAVVGGVMGQVLDSIDKRVAAEFDKIEVKGKEERERMVVDKEYIEMKMKALKWVEWKGENLEEVLERKIPIATPKPPAPTSPSLPPAPEKKSMERNSLDSNNKPGSPAPAAQPQQHSYKPRIPSLNPFSRRTQTLPPQNQATSNSASNTSATTPQAEETAAAVAAHSSDQASAEVDRSDQAKEESTSEETPPVPSKDSPRENVEELTSQVNSSSAPQESISTELQSTEEGGDGKEDGEESKKLDDAIVSSSPADVSAAIEDREAVPTEDGPAIGEDSKSTEEPETKEDSQLRVEKEEEKTKTEAEPSTTPVTVDSNPAIVEESTSTSQPENGSTSSSTATSIPQASSAIDPNGSNSSPSEPKSTLSTPNATPTATPTKPARMSLQQRLAEAARKRGAQQAQAQSQGQNPSSNNAGSNSNSNSSSPQATPESTTTSLPSLPPQTQNEASSASASQDQSKSHEQSPSQERHSAVESSVTSTSESQKLTEHQEEQEAASKKADEQTQENSSVSPVSATPLPGQSDVEHSAAEVQSQEQSEPSTNGIVESNNASPDTKDKEEIDLASSTQEAQLERNEVASEKEPENLEVGKETKVQEEEIADMGEKRGDSGEEVGKKEEDVAPSVTEEGEDQDQDQDDAPESISPADGAAKSNNGGGGGGKKKKKKGKKGKK